MRFRFRLARVLSFVEINEREKQLEVAACVRDKEVLVNRKNRLEKEMTNLLEGNQHEEGLTHPWSMFRNQKIVLNRNEIASLEVQLVKAQEALDEKIFELRKISLKKKALGELREKRKREFDTKQNQRDQKKLDESFRLSKLGKSS